VTTSTRYAVHSTPSWRGTFAGVLAACRPAGICAVCDDRFLGSTRHDDLRTAYCVPRTAYYQYPYTTDSIPESLPASVFPEKECQK